MKSIGFDLFLFFIRPIISLSWSQIISHSNNVFEFATIEPLRKQSEEIDLTAAENRDKLSTGFLVNFLRFHFCSSYFSVLEALLSMSTAQRDVQEEYLRLRGQMLYVHEWKAIIYLATPV